MGKTKFYRSSSVASPGSRPSTGMLTIPRVTFKGAGARRSKKILKTAGHECKVSNSSRQYGASRIAEIASLKLNSEVAKEVSQVVLSPNTSSYSDTDASIEHASPAFDIEDSSLDFSDVDLAVGMLDHRFLYEFSSHYENSKIPMAVFEDDKMRNTEISNFALESPRQADELSWQNCFGCASMWNHEIGGTLINL
eukprot:309424-Hanusia_phi.AAC.7